MATNTKTRTPDTILADSVPVGQRGVAILNRLREIAAIEKAARDVKDEKTALSSELIGLTKGAKHATFQGLVVATRVDSSAQVIDTALLREVYPEAASATIGKKPYSYYRQA